MSDYRKLFLKIRNSIFIRPLSPGQEIRFLNQADKDAGRPPFLHHFSDKQGNGLELLYGSDGKPILEVNLRQGKPYGRAKMYNKDGERTLPNSYWYYDRELDKDNFYPTEKIEREIRKENQETPKEKRISEDELNKKIDKLYENENFFAQIEILGELTEEVDNYLKSNFNLSLKKRFGNQR